LDTNPDAPRVILVGDGEDIMRSAELLCHQTSPIPTFVKRAPHEWEYLGEYVAERWSSEPDELWKQQERSGRYDLTRVIFLAERDSMGTA
jgi:hypothetical protein